ncbi:MAG TPA: hypothetical protein VK395_37480 [Gemmataceae bacterium]|nr:hypothetical protein [Gemmataceae bacterium]
MLELFSANPWLIVIVLGCLIPISAIVLGTVTTYLQKSRQAELDASLKHDMLQRGMSADDIVRVLEAGSGRRGKRCQSGHTSLQEAEQPKQ